MGIKIGMKWKVFYFMNFFKKRYTINGIENDNDGLFLDADMILLDQINDVDKTKDLGVSLTTFQKTVRLVKNTDTITLE